jgi:hypothetical protein
MSEYSNSFEEHSTYLPVRDEQAEYIFSPIVSAGHNINNDQSQYSPPHIQQLTNERDSTAQYSLPISMPLSSKIVNSSQYTNYEYNEQISSNVDYSPTPMQRYIDDNNDCVISTTQYSTSCSIPVQQYINYDSTSQYSSQHPTLITYSSVEMQQIYDKNPQQPILNYPLPHDNLCEDFNPIFRFQIPGFEIIINPSNLTNDYHPRLQNSSQPSTLTHQYTHNNIETQHIYDKNEQQPISNLPFPHGNLCDDFNNSFRFQIPGFDITFNPST